MAVKHVWLLARLKYNLPIVGEKRGQTGQGDEVDKDRAILGRRIPEY